MVGLHIAEEEEPLLCLPIPWPIYVDIGTCPWTVFFRHWRHCCTPCWGRILSLMEISPWNGHGRKKHRNLWTIIVKLDGRRLGGIKRRPSPRVLEPTILHLHPLRSMRIEHCITFPMEQRRLSRIPFWLQHQLQLWMIPPCPIARLTLNHHNHNNIITLLLSFQLRVPHWCVLSKSRCIFLFRIFHNPCRP